MWLRNNGLCIMFVYFKIKKNAQVSSVVKAVRYVIIVCRYAMFKGNPYNGSLPAVLQVH